jgi:phosphoribosyl-ATP pyrophosphohydrolase/phosphoribosyl-AMP cyclohydrolase
MNQLTLENIDQLDWSKESGLLPAIVQNANSGIVLMLGYVNQASLLATLQSRLVTFFSRSRQTLWVKGETSGHALDLVSAHFDCDRDSILILANPRGPTCHTGDASCFGSGVLRKDAINDIDFLKTLEAIVRDRMQSHSSSPQFANSYTAKLFASGIDRMAQKVGEEAVETVIEAKNNNLEKFQSEAADLLFHLTVLLAAKGTSLAEVAQVLRKRNTRS